MLDLSQETLVPLRTRFKMRNGSIAIFIEDGQDEGDGKRYRLCAEGTGGSWRADANGLASVRAGPRDIVAIARKPDPIQVGDFVRITGAVAAIRVQGANGRWYDEADFVSDYEAMVSNLSVRGEVQIANFTANNIRGGTSWQYTVALKDCRKVRGV